ncbi:MAG: molybdopterin converting factor subunit 1 [Thermoanaerobaculia bacterium]
MTVRLLYFASFREAAGTDEETRSLAEGTTVGALWEELRAGLPYFAKFVSMPAAAVNCEYVSAARTLADNDEIAFLPPVAGG